MDFQPRSLKNRLLNSHFLILLLIIPLGFVYLTYIWQHNVEKTQQQATVVAQSFVASLDYTKVSQLTATTADLDLPAYQILKHQLQEFIALNSQARFAYLYTYQHEVFKFNVDSEPASSPDYSPPGQVYYEASTDDLAVFTTGKISLTKPVSDRWGTWISILIPLRDPQSQQIKVVFGVDYDAQQFYQDAIVQTLIAGMLYTLMSMVVIGAFYLASINLRLKLNQQFTQQVQSQQEQLFDEMRQGFALHEVVFNDQGQGYDYRYLKVNKAFCAMLGLSESQILGHTVLELFPATEPYWIGHFIEVAISGKAQTLENFSASIGRYYEVSAYSPELNQFAVIVSDITERKQQEQQIIYLNTHDQLTGFYNRNYFIQSMNQLLVPDKLPLGIILGDINGLKITNEAFGREIGDQLITKSAAIMKTFLDDQAMVFKWDGDEFLIILPNTNNMAIMDYLTATKEELNQADLSVSFGFAIVNHQDEMEHALNIAENMMLTNKTFESDSFRGQTINLILKTLNEKNPREEQHSRRVSELCGQISHALGLSISEINMMKTVGLIHDIGKIGIDEQLLNKPGKLSPEEFTEIKKHTEIGYRILSETNETSLLAKYILAHHERLDGSGYPHGIRGDEIAIYTRILSIADAYDAMTSFRTYRNSFTSEEAVLELMRFVDTQFDRTIVEVFISQVLNLTLPVQAQVQMGGI
jgi:diguanylate cyclase (GGDEF)-like protein/PAS domain S-box-containing protein